MNLLLESMMGKPSIKSDTCPICGKRASNDHHIVPKGTGNKYLIAENGQKLESPTISLCGFGNNLADANGRFYCHGLAHAHMLHFRWIPKTEVRKSNMFASCKMSYGQGHWEYLKTNEPVKYEKALDMDGWAAVMKCN